jgi:hypothetical protein
MSYGLASSIALDKIEKILVSYLRLPFSGDSIPGAFLEAVIAHIYDAEVLNTYDYVDVIDRTSKVGWSVKSTRASTPLTWKRAKIANKPQLIKASLEGNIGLQALGDAIIDFCNSHAHESMRIYDLDRILYARLILNGDGSIVYFERELCSIARPDIFDKSLFSWQWSVQKDGRKKEQLSALHGTHLPSGRKWWAWHGLGENQLHFSGESSWWPAKDDSQARIFKFPSSDTRLSLEKLTELLERL